VAAARRAGLEFDLALALVERRDRTDVNEAGAIFDRLGVDPASVTPLWQVFDKVTSLSGC
jgi:hypothetical protein